MLGRRVIAAPKQLKREVRVSQCGDDFFFRQMNRGADHGHVVCSGKKQPRCRGFHVRRGIIREGHGLFSIEAHRHRIPAPGLRPGRGEADE